MSGRPPACANESAIIALQINAAQSGARYPINFALKLMAPPHQISDCYWSRLKRSYHTKALYLTAMVRLRLAFSKSKLKEI
ncbi:hypothetical protein AXG89_33875 [Burkholderia sp. PAMC 26561]|nr:hypothetical protein AXG89_33875 [Burkholderia sp. PAMC 26561]